jgi:hypothetical protein
MRPNPLDEDSASRLLQGLVHPDDAPPGYGSAAGLLAAAAQLQLVTVDEEAAAATVSAMVEAIRDGASTPQTHRRRSMLGKLLAGKALAALGVVALTATGAAAASGTLPDQVQGVVAGAVSHVGVNLPDPGAHGQSADHRPTTDPGQSGADHGQSGADQGQPGDPGQAGVHGQGSDISTLTHSLPAGQPKGPTVCAKASDGKCQPTQPGKGSGDDGSTSSTVGSGEDHAATPTTGSIATGEDHSGDHATTPTTGSIATGEDHSGDLGSSSSGKGPDSSQH